MNIKLGAKGAERVITKKKSIQRLKMEEQGLFLLL